MPRVDFYILANGGNSDRFACAIASKAWQSGNKVHIHTASADTTNRFDDLLWTYKDISFLPHEVFDVNTDEETPITIGYADQYPESAQVMVNLGPDVPDFAGKFERVIEIVGDNESDKQLARERYRQYKNADYEIHNHTIDKLTEHG